MAILRINGTVIHEGVESSSAGLENAYVAKEILLSTTRGEAAAVEEEIKANSVYEIITSDGVSWVVSGEELLANYTRKVPATRGGSSSEQYELTTEWIVPNTKRGLGDILNFKKLIKWGFKKTPAPLVNLLLPKLVQKIDEHLVPDEGLFTWNYKEDFKPKITAPSQLSTSEEILLFIHGTIANAQGTYGDLFEGENDPEWKLVKEKYNGRVYTFQHYTLGKSPLVNTLDLLSVLPDGVKFNLVTSSRGGLIGELLTMVSVYKTNPAYLATLRSTLADAGREEDLPVLDKIIEIAKTKKITITDYHRVACPAFGTTLVSTRLDIYLKVILNLIGLIPALKASIIYDLVKSLVLEVVKSKANTEILPGVEAMIPKSPFIKGMNAVSQQLDAKLKIFAGDVDPKGFFQTLGVFLTDVFYRADHDFIVNSYSMFRGIRRSQTHYIFHKGNNVSHFNYYFNPQTRKILYASLKGLGSTTMNTLPVNMDLTQEDLLDDPEVVISRGLYTERLKKLYDGKVSFTAHEHEEAKIDISIKNGDLGYAKYPLIVGHIKGDGIVSSEKAIDPHMGYRLSQRHKAGIYPGNLETSEVFFNDGLGFKGAVVIGLGTPGKLTGQSLAAAYQHGAVNFALKSRHEQNEKGEIGLSTLLVGSDYAGLSLRTAIRSMIDGITAANQQLRLLNDATIPVIKYLEIVELYHDRAILATRFINYLMANEYEKQLIKKEPLMLFKAGGSQKRIPDDYSQDWWYRLQITAKVDKSDNIDSLEYLLMNNGARADAMKVEIQGEFLAQIIKASISEAHSDDSLLKLLFNILVPNSIKEFTNDKRNILLVLEGQSAQIPWEMLFNKEKESDQPISVKSGMVRQLRVDEPLTSVAGSALNNMLIVGNPITNEPGYPSLEGAAMEAEKVFELMNGQYNCNKQVEKPFMDIMKALIDAPYRIMHLAGHGDYDPKTKRSGMILSDGIRLSPTEIAKLSTIPELVFINCCHLGKTKQSKVQWNELAANLGTQFIQHGVKCVIAAGWAVNDQSALFFAEQFYKHMLDGDEFGEAVKKARTSIYDPSQSDNTWGAYQCYGDPFYKLKPKETLARERIRPYHDVTELMMDLENLLQQINPKSTRDNYTKIEEFIDRIGELCKTPEWRELPEVIEAIGNCYCELGNEDKAIELYRRLLEYPTGSYKLDSLYRLSRLAVEKAASLETDSPGNKRSNELLALSHHITDVALKLTNTPDKRILKGGNLKREASMYTAKKRTAKLVEARKEYRYAFEMTLKSRNIYDHHALSGWIVLEELLRSYKPSLGDLKNDPKQHLEPALKYLAGNTGNVIDLANLSAQAELEFCKLFISKRSVSARTKTEKAICDKYKQGWGVEGSFSKAKIIISQFNLLTVLFKDRKTQAGILRSIENITAQLETIFNLPTNNGKQ